MIIYFQAKTYGGSNARYVWPPYEVFKPCDIFGNPSSCEGITITPYVYPTTTTTTTTATTAGINNGSGNATVTYDISHMNSTEPTTQTYIQRETRNYRGRRQLGDRLVSSYSDKEQTTTNKLTTLQMITTKTSDDTFRQRDYQQVVVTVGDVR